LARNSAMCSARRRRSGCAAERFMCAKSMPERYVCVQTSVSSRRDSNHTHIREVCETRQSHARNCRPSSRPQTVCCHHHCVSAPSQSRPPTEGKQTRTCDTGR
jgi:hypothetical protein